MGTFINGHAMASPDFQERFVGTLYERDGALSGAIVDHYNAITGRHNLPIMITNFTSRQRMARCIPPAGYWSPCQLIR